MKGMVRGLIVCSVVGMFILGIIISAYPRKSYNLKDADFTYEIIKENMRDYSKEDILNYLDCIYTEDEEDTKNKIIEMILSEKEDIFIDFEMEKL